MTDNAYLGESTVNLSGKAYTLVYTWRGLAEIQTKFGGNILKELFSGLSPLTVAEIIHIGLKKNHPEITLDHVIDSSPPMIPTLQALDRALALAYFGADGIPTSEPAQDVQSPDDKKKTA